MGLVQSQAMNALQLVQQNFSLLKMGGQFLVVDEGELTQYRLGTIDQELNFYNERNSKILIERFLTNQPVPGIPKQVFLQYLNDPNTHVYDEIKFHPKKQPRNILNLWVPPTIEPIDTPYHEIVDFLFSVIASNDRIIFEYLRVLRLERRDGGARVSRATTHAFRSTTPNARG